MNKWEDLSKALRAEGGDTFLLARITAGALQEAHETGMGVTIEESGHIVACGFLWPTDEPGVLELGTLWVHPKHRGQGLSSKVFAQRLTLPAAANKKLFIVSHEPIVAHHTHAHGFTEATGHTWSSLLNVHHTCGPCDRVSNEQKPNCPLKAVRTECRLFVR